MRYGTTNVMDVEVKNGVLRWLENMQRMSEGRMTMRVLFTVVQGGRRWGTRSDVEGQS